MNKQTERALRGSIRKWALIVDGRGEDKGPRNCPLCNLYIDNESPCLGCPVREETGQPHCNGSPYWQFFDAYEKEYPVGTWGDDPITVIGPRTQAAAIAEHDFLVSLLPENQR